MLAGAAEMVVATRVAAWEAEMVVAGTVAEMVVAGTEAEMVVACSSN